MRELTLKQKNEMIDFVVDKCANQEKYGDWANVGICKFGSDFLLENGIYKDDNTFYAQNNIKKIFPEILPKNVRSCRWFLHQSERIIYLLLVKEFINTGQTSTRNY